eukprot:XP_025001183.1 uncharacterized protein LOC112530869 [Gallus gallus]
MSFGIKYYYDFLEKLSGKEKFRKVVFKAPWLLDTLVSRVAPVASLTHSGRLVVFPMFQKQVAPKPPPRIFRKASGDLHGEGKQKKEGALPPLVQGKKVRFAEVPTYIRRFSVASTAGQSSRSRRSLQQESFSSSPLPAILRTSEAREQPVTWQPQGQAGNERQEHLGQTTGKKHVRFRGDEQGAGEDREAGAAAMWKAKASHPQVAGRQAEADGHEGQAGTGRTSGDSGITVSPFQKQVAPKPPPRIFRKASGDLHGEGKQKKEGALPPLVQGKKVRFAEVPTYIRRFSVARAPRGSR